MKASGAEHVVVDAEDLPKRVREATGGAGIRLAIDCVGGVSTENLARCLDEGGTLVNYGAMSGERCMISPRYFVFRDITLRGFWLSQWFKKATPAQRSSVFGEIAEGMDVITKIGTTATGRQDRPVKDIRIESVTIERV